METELTGAAIDERGTCIRCREPFVSLNYRCANCGVHKDRIVRRPKRRRPIGGKRGRNSGTVGTSKNKK